MRFDGRQSASFTVVEAGECGLNWPRPRVCPSALAVKVPREISVHAFSAMPGHGILPPDGTI